MRSNEYREVTGRKATQNSIKAFTTSQSPYGTVELAVVVAAAGVELEVTTQFVVEASTSIHCHEFISMIGGYRGALASP